MARGSRRASEGGDVTFESLKVGDEVAVFSGYARSATAIRPIEKITAHHFVVDGLRYRRHSGIQAGDGYLRGRIESVTDRNRAAIEAAMLLDRVCGLAWRLHTAERAKKSALTKEDADALAAIVAKAEAAS